VIGRLLSVMSAKILSPLATFVIIVLMARIQGRENLGSYNTVMAWYVLFQFVSIFGMSEYISREVGKDSSTASKHLFHGLLFGLFSSAICICLMTGVATVLGYPGELKYSIIGAGLAIPFGVWTVMCQSVFAAAQKIRYIALTSLVESVLILSLSAYCIFMQYGLLAIIYSMVIGKALASAFTVYVAHRCIAKLRCELDLHFLMALLAPVFAFGVTGIAFQLFMRVGVLMLSKMADMDTVGLYSSASKLTEVCLMFPLAFYMLMLPTVAKDYRDCVATVHQKLETYASELFALVFFVFGFGMMFSTEIVRFIYGEAFMPAVWPLRILLVAYLIQCADMVLGMFCQAAGYHKFTMITAVVRAVANTVFSFAFILIWPMLGAAVSTLVSITLSFVICQRFVTRKMRCFSWAGIILENGSICLIMAMILFCFQDVMSVLMRLVSYSLGYGALFLAIHRISPFKVKCRA
jgi:O-antigen/teichoic acid export membrane protein